MCTMSGHLTVAQGKQLAIPNTYNYYGGLNIREECGKYEMSMENYTGFKWTEIPEYLYYALLRYYEEEQ